MRETTGTQKSTDRHTRDRLVVRVLAREATRNKRHEIVNSALASRPVRPLAATKAVASLKKAPICHMHARTPHTRARARDTQHLLNKR